MKFYIPVKSEEHIKPSIFYLLTSHHPPCQIDRTFRFNIFGHKVFICSRCLAEYLGIIVALMITMYFQVEIKSILIGLIVFGLLPLPATLDWLSQTLRYRTSNNHLRFFTGFMFGNSIGVGITSILYLNLFAIYIFFPIYILYIVIVLWVLQNKKVVQEYVKPYEKFLSIQ